MPATKYIYRSTSEDFSEGIIFAGDDQTVSIIWYYDENDYVGFRSHRYAINAIPRESFIRSAGVDDEGGAIAFLKGMMRGSRLRSEGVREFLSSHGLTFSVEPDWNEWVP